VLQISLCLILVHTTNINSFTSYMVSTFYQSYSISIKMVNY